MNTQADQRRGRRPRYRLLLAGAVVGAVAAGAAGSEDKDLGSLVAALADDDYSERASAARTLATSDAYALSDLLGAADGSALTPEQRVRLLSAARERFFATPRAGMGVRFLGGQPVNVQSMVVVDEAMPGFPSAEVLERGDIIVSADGHALHGTGYELIRSLIISRDPGDTIPVVLRRGPELIETEIELGSFRDLANGDPPPRDLVRAWRVRIARFVPGNGRGIGEPIELDFDPRDWRERGLAPARARVPISRQAIVPGGASQALLQHAALGRGSGAVFGGDHPLVAEHVAEVHPDVRERAADPWIARAENWVDVLRNDLVTLEREILTRSAEIERIDRQLREAGERGDANVERARQQRDERAEYVNLLRRIVRGMRAEVQAERWISPDSL